MGNYKDTPEYKKFIDQANGKPQPEPVPRYVKPKAAIRVCNFPESAVLNVATQIAPEKAKIVNDLKEFFTGLHGCEVYYNQFERAYIFYIDITTQSNKQLLSVAKNMLENESIYYTLK